METEAQNPPPHQIQSYDYVLQSNDELEHSQKRPFDPLSRIHALCGSLVQDSRFKNVVVSLIIANSICMGIATFDFVTKNELVLVFFDRLDTTFLVLFTIELILNFGFWGLALFWDGWLLFDLAVVLSSWMFASLSVFRAFRILRAFRLIAKMKDLKELVWALLSVLPRIFAVGLLLLLLFYVFAVMFTSLFKDLYVEGYTDEDYFGRLDKTIFTLFQMMTLDSWSSLTKQMMQKHWWAWAPMITFIIISTFIVINLIIAVICEAVAAIQTQQVVKQVDTIKNTATDKADQNRIDVLRLESQIKEMAEKIELMSQELLDRKKAE
mmetsp:Transcript_11263/g.16051  ORF Transcript_11263/g.16051 Transcript_11263/m.16051 type:complete len:324 (-) Transcript_11263:420-1391(-)